MRHERDQARADLDRANLEHHSKVSHLISKSIRRTVRELTSLVGQHQLELKQVDQRLQRKENLTSEEMDSLGERHLKQLKDAEEARQAALDSIKKQKEGLNALMICC